MPAPCCSAFGSAPAAHQQAPETRSSFDRIMCFQMVASADSAEALKYCQGQANMIEVCWDVYQAMGPQGALWSPLAEADPLAAKEAFCKKLQVFEEKTLGARLSCLRRWNSFLVHHNGARALLSPDAKSLYAFLKEVDGGGPTAAAS